MNAMQISVVIPTYQRRDSITLAMQALTHQTLSPRCYEVIVSIDGSDDGTRELVAQYDAPFQLRALWQPNKGRAAACNAGIRSAEGDIIALLDDDMQAAPGFLAAHIQEHPRGSRRAVVGAAPIRYDNTLSPVAAYVAGKFNRHLSRLAQPGYQIGLRDCYSGNFSVRRDVLLDVGLFDEAFKVYGNEDLELALRLRQAGVQIEYSSTALAYQAYTKDFAGLARDSINKGRTAVLMISKHPETAIELKIGTYRQASWLRQLLLRGLFGLSAVWDGTPTLLITLIEKLEPRRPKRLDLYYELLLDYCYWYGVRDALREHQLVQRWPKSLPTPVKMS